MKNKRDTEQVEVMYLQIKKNPLLKKTQLVHCGSLKMGVEN